MQSTLKKVRVVAFVKDFIDNARYKIVKGGQLDSVKGLWLIIRIFRTS